MEQPNDAAAAPAPSPAAAAAALLLSAAERAASISAKHHSHKDDEGTGRTILWSLVLVVGVCQAGVFFWKRHHPSSFNLMSLLAMWLIPAGWAVAQGDFNPLRAPFAYVWLVFSLLMAALLAAVHQRTLAEATPGVVYGVLEQVYLQCMWVSSSVLTGICVLVMVPPLGNLAPPWALTLFFGAGLYAVYFAVLARDITGVISDKLVKRLGLTAQGSGGAGDKASKDGKDGKDGTGSSSSSSSSSSSLAAGSPASASRSHSHRDKCALCGGGLDIVDEGTVVEEGAEGASALHLSGRPYALRRADGSIVIIHPGAGAPPPSPARAPAGGSAAGAGPEAAPKTMRFASRDGKTIMFQLTCKHIFHRTCLAGWCVVGKKGVCPCCSERVEMGVVYSHSPLIGTQSAMFAQILEMARYMVV